MAAFRGMHVSSAKHTVAMCDYQGSVTIGQTPNKVILMCRYASQAIHCINNHEFNYLKLTWTVICRYYCRRQPYFSIEPLHVSKTGYWLGICHGWYHLHGLPRAAKEWKRKLQNEKVLPTAHMNFSFIFFLYAPTSIDQGHFVFVLSVCLSVVNFNLRYYFWTIRERDLIFGLHVHVYSTNTALSNDTKVNDLNCDLCTKISFFRLCRWQEHTCTCTCTCSVSPCAFQ